MVNCETVEILSYCNGLAGSAGFELPDLGDVDVHLTDRSASGDVVQRLPYLPAKCIG